MLLSWTLFFATVHFTRGQQCQSNSVSLYSEKWQSAVIELTKELKTIFQASNTRAAADTNLYVMLTTRLNVSESEEGKMRFSAAMFRITQAFYEACFERKNSRPMLDEQNLLYLFSALLHDRISTSYNSLLQETYGELLCLKHAHSAGKTLVDCDRPLTISSLHCINEKHLVCLFDLDPSFNTCTSPKIEMKTANVIGFLIDASPSDSGFFTAMKKLITSYITGSNNDESEHTTSCFIVYPLQQVNFKVYCSDSVFALYDIIEESQIKLYNISDLLEDLKLFTDYSNIQTANSSLSKVVQFISNLFSKEIVIHSQIVIFATPDSNKFDRSIIEGAKDNEVLVSFFLGTQFSDHIHDYKLIAKQTNGVAILGNSDDFNKMMKFLTKIPITTDISEREFKFLDSNCKAFNLSVFVHSFSCLVKTSQPQIIIENPHGMLLTLNTVANTFVIHEDDVAIEGEWKMCATGGLFELSLVQEIKFEFSLSFLEETSDGNMSTTNPFACDVQTFILSTEYQSYISFSSLNLSVISNQQNNSINLQTTNIKECNGVLYGSLMLPSHSNFHFQLCGFDNKGNYFTYLDTSSVVQLQYPHINFWLIGSQTILLNPGTWILIRIAIENASKGPQNLPLLIEVAPGRGIDVKFENGNKIVIRPQREYEFHIYLLASEALAVGLSSTSFVEFSVNSDCIQSKITHQFQTISQTAIQMNVTNISQTSLSLQWNNPDLANPVSSYFISLDFTNGTKDILSFDPDILQCTLTGLSPDQQIYVGIIATTTNPNEFAGFTPRPIRTKESAPTVVSFVNARILSSQAAFITWMNHSGNILYYKISVFADDQYRGNVILNTSVCSYNLTNLSPFIMYTVVIEAENSAGTGPSKKISFYTKEGVPKSPENFTATVQSSTSISLTWVPPSLKNRRGFIIGYLVFLEEHRNGRTQTLVLPGNSTSIRIDGLEHFSNLTVALSARSSEGFGSNVTLNILISTGVPSPPQNFVGEFIHSSSVALFWNAPKYPNGIVLGYYVHVSRRKYNISVENMWVRHIPSHKASNQIYMHRLSRLLSGEYQCHVLAENSFGLGKKSRVISFKIQLTSDKTTMNNNFKTSFTVMTALGCLVAASIIILVLILLTIQKKKKRKTKGCLIAKDTLKAV